MNHNWYWQIWDCKMLRNSFIQSFSFFLLLSISFIHILSFFVSQAYIELETKFEWVKSLLILRTWLSCKNFSIGIPHLIWIFFIKESISGYSETNYEMRYKKYGVLPSGRNMLMQRSRGWFPRWSFWPTGPVSDGSVITLSSHFYDSPF